MEEPQGCQILQYSDYFLKPQLLKWWEKWRLQTSGGFCFFKEFLILLLVQKKQGPGDCSPRQEQRMDTAHNPGGPGLQSSGCGRSVLRDTETCRESR